MLCNSSSSGKEARTCVLVSETQDTAAAVLRRVGALLSSSQLSLTQTGLPLYRMRTGRVHVSVSAAVAAGNVIYLISDT